MAKLSADFESRVIDAVHAEANLGLATCGRVVAERTGCHTSVANSMLERLYQRGTIRKIGQGSYAPRHLTNGRKA